MSNIVPVSSYPTANEFILMKEMASVLVKSGFLPTSVRTPEQCLTIMLKGRELGIGPMEAFAKISVVQGKPTIESELMLSLIYRRIPGAVIDIVTTTNEECVIEARRPNGKTTQFRFDMEDAKTAGLHGKGPWKSYPAAMLRARCISATARALFPDALSGVSYTPEELGAPIDVDGEIRGSSPAEHQIAREQKEIQKAVIDKAQSPLAKAITATIKPGEWPIRFGTKEKGYLGLTIAQAVDRDGMEKVEQYIDRLIERHTGGPTPRDWIEMHERVIEYKNHLNRELARLRGIQSETPKTDELFSETPLTEEEEMQVERMINDERMGIGRNGDERFDSFGGRDS